MVMSAPARTPLMRLLREHVADLKRSGLHERTIATWGAYSVEVDQKSVMAQLGFPYIDPPALALPILPPDRTEPNLNDVILKPDRPRLDTGGRSIKYEARQRSRNRIHAPLSIRYKLADTSVPLVITEGQKKGGKSGTGGNLHGRARRRLELEGPRGSIEFPDC